MNFNSIFEELNKLYDEEKAEKPEQVEGEVKDEPVKEEEAVEEGCTKTLKEAADAEAEIVDDEAVEEPIEEPVVEEEPRQLIIECSKCGAVVIKDEADVVIDEESGLVNLEDACEYCEEAEGYKIIGVVAPYEAVAEEPVEEEPVEEETIEEEEELDELFNVNANVDLRDFGGTGNDVSVLSSPLESLDAKKLAEEDEDLDEFLNANIKVDARGFGGSGNAVDII